MPMHLTSIEGDVEFELALIEHRLEDLQESGGADRYATISFRVGTRDESWEETAPSINMFQLRSLADWLEALAEGGPELDRVELLEINLSFDVERQTDDDVTVLIGFHLQNRPEWAIIDAPTEEAGFIRIRVSREAAGAAGRELREDLRSLGWA